MSKAAVPSTSKSYRSTLVIGSELVYAESVTATSTQLFQSSWYVLLQCLTVKSY
jgi:hypothetical protein